MLNSKRLIVFGLILMTTGLSRAQGIKVLELQAGYLNPKDTPAGMILGGNYGIAIDERMDLTIGLSYFHKNYTETLKIGETYIDPDTKEETIIKKKEYNTTLLPLMANISVHIPIQPSLNWYIGGSFGYQWLFMTRKDSVQSKKYHYSGFGWIGRGGLEFNIGSRSFLLIEAFYNSAKPKHEVKKDTWDQVNVSGLGFRAGVRLILY
jgi:hypothetical protein